MFIIEISERHDATPNDVNLRKPVHLYLECKDISDLETTLSQLVDKICNVENLSENFEKFVTGTNRWAGVKPMYEVAFPNLFPVSVKSNG